MRAKRRHSENQGDNREDATLTPAGNPACVKRYWEIITDNLSKAGWSLGCLSAVDSNGRTIWIADAYRDAGKRFVVRADEKLTATILVVPARALDRAKNCF